jgi:hypothetical protein
MIRPLSIAALLGAALLASGCAPAGPPASSGPAAAKAGPACRGAPSLDRACRGEDDEPENRTFYRDRVDAGDDPRTPGCHRIHSERTCTDEGRNFTGDYCLGDVLVEFTNRDCHTHQAGGPDDRRDYNCRDYCRQQGRSSGFCSVVDDVCPGAPRAESARCVCHDRPGA